MNSEHPFSPRPPQEAPFKKRRAGPPLSEEGFPTLTLRLEAMRLNLTQALMGQQEEIVELVQTELDRECTVEKLREIVGSLVASQIRESTAKEIKRYFEYGDGADAIKEAVAKGLKKATDGLYART